MCNERVTSAFAVAESRPFEVRIGEQIICIAGEAKNRVEVQLNLQPAWQTVQRNGTPALFQPRELQLEDADRGSVRRSHESEIALRIIGSPARQARPESSHLLQVQELAELEAETRRSGVLGIRSGASNRRDGGEKGRCPRRHANTAPVGS